MTPFVAAVRQNLFPLVVNSRPRSLQHYTDHLDGLLFIGRMDAAMRKLSMREIRGSEDMQMKMSRDRQTSRILSHLARATALPHASRRKL
jgi:hypothetical protein